MKRINVPTKNRDPSSDGNFMVRRDALDSSDKSVYVFNHASSDTAGLMWSRYDSYNFDNMLGSAQTPYRCVLDTVIIYGGVVYCHSYNGYYDTKTITYMLMFDIKNGDLLHSKLFMKENIMFEYFVDDSQLWIAYINNGVSMLNQLDSETLMTLRSVRTPLKKNDRSSNFIMVCGKVYVLQFNADGIYVTDAFDVNDPENLYPGKTYLGPNPRKKINQWSTHVNPLLNEIFLNTKDGRNIQFKISLDTCGSRYTSYNLNIINNTFLWSMRQYSPERMRQKVGILEKLYNMTEQISASSYADSLSQCFDHKCVLTSRSTDLHCQIDNVLRSIEVLSHIVRPSGPRDTHILDFNLDMGKLLRQKFGRHIIDKIEELKGTILESFDSLRNSLSRYFTTVARFDQGKANADIDFIHGRLDKFKIEVTDMTNSLGHTLSALGKAAIGSTSAEVADKAATLAMTIAANMNPLKILFDSGGAVEIKKAIDELAKAASTLARAIKVVVKTLPKLSTELLRLNRQMAKNIKKQENIKHMFISGYNQNLNAIESLSENYMQDFLKQYQNYDPIFSRGMFAYAGELLQETIEQLCELIYAGDSAASSVAQTVITSLTDCLGTKALANRLIETNEEMYDNQFELIEAMANFARATITMNAASMIANKTSKLKKPDPNSLEGRLFGFHVYVTTKSRIWGFVRDACNLIEYQNYGITINLCGNIMLDQTSQKFDDLVAYKYDKDACSNDVSVKYFNIPAAIRNKESNYELPLATIDLGRLYAGKEVTFQVPNKDWLIENGWFDAKDSQSAHFVQSFELILPPIFRGQPSEATVHTVANMDGNNRIYPDRQRYIFYSRSHNKVVPVQYDFRYSNGYPSCASGTVLENPYNLQECDQIERPCVVSEGTRELTHYPSIFARWKLRAFMAGNSKLIRPDPVGVFTLKARLKVCHAALRTVPLLGAGVALARPVHTSSCCGDHNKVMNSRINRCEKCPVGSCPNIEGYYCDRNCTNVQASSNHDAGTPIIIG